MIKSLAASRALVLFGLLAVVSAGCQGGSMPPQANPDQAREALTTALETWKKGESIDALTQRDPPIHFNDSKARTGTQLVDFHLEDSHDFYGQTARIPVVLTLKRPDGSTREKKAAYLIDTAPAIVIVPE